MLQTIQNAVLFQVGWFSCVLAGASSIDMTAGLLIAAVILMIHLSVAGDAKKETILMLVVVSIGLAWDGMMTVTGIFEFSSDGLYTLLIPLWLIAIWALFATTLNVSLRWLKGRFVWAALLGGIGGPAAYLAGEKLGAVSFADTIPALLIIGIGWAFIMPALILISMRLDGFDSKEVDENERGLA